MPKINHEKIALYLEKLVAGWDEELAREMIENLTPDERVHLSRLLDICRKGKPAPA
jgi:rubrerythrin